MQLQNASEFFLYVEQFFITDCLYEAEFSPRIFPETAAAMSNLSEFFAATIRSEYVTADIPTCSSNENNYLRVTRKMECKKN